MGDDGSAIDDDGDGQGDAEDEGGAGWDGELMVRQGPWNAVSAAFSGDPCGWESTYSEVTRGYTLNFLLPRSFEVESFDGGFEIEAQRYGARGPIICAFDGSDFSCETQQVRPGYKDWLYEIDFTGSIISDESIEGSAVVTVTADDLTRMELLSAGIDPAVCDITVDLQLNWGNW